MARTVELRRHTANDQDALTPEGVEAAVAIGARISHPYDLIVSSGMQRATQTIACMLGATTERMACGVTVDSRFHSDHVDRWYAVFERAGAPDLAAFLAADPELVAMEAATFGAALADVFEALVEEDRALVMGHGPTQEVAVYGLTGELIPALGKGEGVLVVSDENGLRIGSAD